MLEDEQSPGNKDIPSKDKFGQIGQLPEIVRGIRKNQVPFFKRLPHKSQCIGFHGIKINHLKFQSRMMYITYATGLLIHRCDTFTSP